MVTPVQCPSLDTVWPLSLAVARLVRWGRQQMTWDLWWLQWVTRWRLRAGLEEAEVLVEELVQAGQQGQGWASVVVGALLGGQLPHLAPATVAMLGPAHARKKS